MHSPNNHREVIFEHIRDTTREILSEEAVQAELGMRANEITVLLENAFSVERRLGRLIISPDQLEQNNLGIHPIVASDITLPDFSPYLRHLLQDAAEIGSDEKKIRTWYYPLLPFYLVAMPTAALCRPPTKTLEKGTVFRHLVILGKKLPKLPKPLMAAIVGHELDHALVHRELDQSGQGLAYSPEDYKERILAYSTKLERSAYGVSAAVLRACACIPRQITPDGVLRRIEGKSPEDSGKRLKVYFRRVRLKHPGILWRSEVYIARVAIVSFGALALTQLYGKESDSPTEDEIKAYKAAGLIHA